MTLSTTSPEDPDDPLEAQAVHLAEEMAAAWRRGERPSAEVFLALRPEFADHRQAAVRLIYEEVCLREEAGLELPPERYLERFPRWGDELTRLLDVHCLLGPAHGSPQFPAVGQTLGDFVVRAELGRGAHGRVFLASQMSLADRPVVLKVTPIGGAEHLTLALLQHTHIIPINGAQDFPGLGLRALCMPYHGGTTLERLLAALRDQPLGRRTGQQLLEALDRSGKEAPIPLPGRRSAGPIARGSFAQAICWIGACLAEALHYAHERGVLHLDLKPSNVLLTADGQPLLLDFHLARGPVGPDGDGPEWLGGTPAYMSPEQEAALSALRAGHKAPSPVDGRSDIYGLGVLLYEALAGELPARSGPPARPSRLNPQVSAGLESILRRCLAPDPRGRYADAAALAADLRRHLADLPLRGVANRSLAERWAKLRRRQPHVPAVAGMLLAVLAAAAVVGINTVSHVIQRHRDTATALAEGRNLLAARHYPEATRTLTRGLALAEGLQGGRSLADELARQLRIARRATMADQLHDAADRLRYLAAAEVLPPVPSRAVADRCLALWDARGRLLGRAGAELDAATERRIETDLGDLAALWGDLAVRLADRGDRDRAHREALRRLDEAEAILPPSPLLCLQRRVLAEALGLTAEARAAARQSAELAPQTAWDHTALGLALLRAGAVAPARDEFRRARALRPQDFWAHFYEGTCSARLGFPRDAESSFRICIALDPASASCSYNLARTLQESGRLDDARHEYDRALELDPSLAPAALNRGILLYEQGRLEEAAADLGRALELGADPAAALYNLALIDVARGDRQAARAAVRRALSSSPDHAQALELQARLDRDP